MVIVLWVPSIYRCMRPKLLTGLCVSHVLLRPLLPNRWLTSFPFIRGTTENSWKERLKHNTQTGDPKNIILHFLAVFGLRRRVACKERLVRGLIKSAHSVNRTVTRHNTIASTNGGRVKHVCSQARRSRSRRSCSCQRVGHGLGNGRHNFWSIFTMIRHYSVRC